MPVATIASYCPVTNPSLLRLEIELPLSLSLSHVFIPVSTSKIANATVAADCNKFGDNLLVENTLDVISSTSFDFYKEICRKNVAVLKDKFQSEFKSHTFLEEQIAQNLQLGFETLARQIAQIKYEKAIVEITRNNALKFSLYLGNNKILMVTKPLEEVDDLNSNTVIASLFDNRERIFSDATNLTYLVQAMQEYSAV
jgi:hypothetical protein